jgi:hypothetical protein
VLGLIQLIFSVAILVALVAVVMLQVRRSWQRVDAGMNTDRLMAWAQIALSFGILGLIFAALFLYETGHVSLNVEQQKSFDSLLDWLKSIGSLIVFFWFQRLRQGGIPDNSQTVTQIHTAPDGSKTTISSPVGAPAAAVPTLATTSNSLSQPADSKPLESK